jgi:hypothetical protein
MDVDLTTLLVSLALLFASFVKGATGLGFPVIATPTLALLLDIRTAVTILIIPNLVMDAAQVTRGGFPFVLLRRFAGLVLLAIIGVFLGTKILVTLPLWVLNSCLGIMVLSFVLSTWLQLEVTISPRMEKLLSPPAGLISGFLNGMTNAGGPSLAIYLYSLKLPKRDFVKSIATRNLLNWNTLSLSLQVTLLILLGFYVGLKIQDRVNQQTFNRGLLVLLFVIGTTLILRALVQRA